ncbi:MAG: hypothetical protein JST06_01445 [Bacteroidetes bacterium]|nr:hypothetical protein [Bacteroidota bacterium]MBS1630588.1 hypothetical protein [Bacteroidota bacterium]
MILLSPHTDTVFNNPKIAYRDGVHQGLLDNFIGVLVCYLALYQHEGMRRLEREGHVRIYHNRGEEYGYLSDDAPVLDAEEDVVIVVDVCAHDAYADLDVSFENIFEFPELEDIVDELRNEGFRIGTKPYTGDEADADEAFSWVEKGIPVLSFIIPVQAPENNWHRIQCDNTVANEVVERAAQCLARLVLHTL